LFNWIRDNIIEVLKGRCFFILMAVVEGAFLGSMIFFWVLYCRHIFIGCYGWILMGGEGLGGGAFGGVGILL
jgi:hypothetical protein